MLYILLWGLLVGALIRLLALMLVIDKLHNWWNVYTSFIITLWPYKIVSNRQILGYSVGISNFSFFTHRVLFKRRLINLLITIITISILILILILSLIQVMIMAV